MNVKKVLFISYDGMTDPLGQSQVIPYLAGLTRFGYHFTILSCEKPQRFLLYKKNIKELLNSYSIKWAPILYHKNPPVLSSVYDEMQLKKKAIQLHAREKFDMVHTRVGIPALIGLWMKKKWGVKFLHDIREFYADSRVDGGMWNLKNPFYKIIYNYFKSKEDEEVKECDGIVCLTYAAESIIKQWPQFKKGIPLSVIPCSVDMNLFDPQKIDEEKKESLRKELKIDPGDFVISYLGSIGGWYLTDEIMKFCKSVFDKIPASKFLFISPHEHDTILQTAIKFGIPDEKIIIRNSQRIDIPLLLSFSKYSVFFIKSCYSKQSSSPTKHGEIMAMGIPVISNGGVGDIEEIIINYKSGIVLKDLNSAEFETVADTIATGIKFDETAIRNGANEYYNLEHAIDSYREIYDVILAKST